ncbi:ABC transporter substrate-binding protein [Nocardioides pantholopis]|uniref:ABC transporter substrate-binding protein n=1 Tax=Nocardioides pantholopis TaxID=2483798 RepID=UPI000F082F58|nr:ABC transporter substrate-binding protein [Nocardioides pantholopis]
MNRQFARPLGGLLAVLAITSALTACNSDAGGGDSDAGSKAADEICPTAETKGTIKIGMSAPLAVFAPLLVGIETGAFEDAGIDVQIEPLPSAESLPLVARGQLDAQMTSLSSSHFNTLADEVDVKWILPMDNQAELPAGTPVPGYWSHVDVVGDGDEPDLAALKGAEVSTPTGGSGISGLILDNALAEVDLGLGDVNLTAPLVGPDALNALANGAVSAAWISAPLEVEAAKNPDLVPIAGYEPGVTGTAIMAGRTLLDQPELAVKFAAVLSKVTEEHLAGDYRKNPETVALLAKAEEVEESVIENSALLVFSPEFSMEGTEDFASALQEFAMERGELEYDEALDPAGLMDTRITEALATCDDVLS